MPRIDRATLRRMRVAAQLLHRPARPAAEVVRHLAGIQAQAPREAELGIRARARRVTKADVDRALLEERSIVRTWAMRGTIHLVLAEDLGWLVPITVEPSRPTADRRLAQLGLAPGTAERAIGLIQNMLGTEGPLTRAEIQERLRRRRIPTEGQAMAHLTWLAASKGIVCFGPHRSGRPTFVLVRDWLGRPARVEPDRALAELAARYLTAHGPSLPEDMAAWSGLRAGDVRRAWGLIEDRLAVVDTPAGPRWRLKGRRAEAPPRQVRLLPMFDEYLLGWRSRDLVLPERHRRRVVPGGGMIRRAVMADGIIRGTWSEALRAGRLRVTIEPGFAPHRRELTAEAEDVARFRGLAGADLEV